MRELKYTTERYKTRYFKRWSVSVASAIIWSIDNLLDQNLNLGLSRLITSHLRYSQKQPALQRVGEELAHSRLPPSLASKSCSTTFDAKRPSCHTQ